MSINQKIKRLVRYYTKLLGTNNPVKIAEYLGIQIAYLPLGNALGHYKYIKRTKWIFINENILDDTALLNVVLAHELGHALLHVHENCCFMAHHTLLLTSKIERQANLFASYLLVTDDMLNEFKEYTIDQFSSCTGINKELIKLRLEIS